MRKTLGQRFGFLAGVAMGLLLGHSRVQAFPPAPDHIFYGIVRDELGNPIIAKNAEVLLETSTGVQVKTTILTGADAGVNYRLAIPMDAGVTSDAYKPTALKPTVPFKMWVRISGVRYLPIEMKGDYSQLGQPGKRTRLDLTLGEDSDNDGLPDAWERALIGALGGGLTLADIKPGDDSDGDGLSNLQEYVAGTYAFDPDDGFTLDIVGTANSNSLLEFLVIRGHTYKVMGSTDLKTWIPVSFKVAGSDNVPATVIYGSDTRQLRVEVIAEPGQGLTFFKLMVQ